ncbi:MAG: hypothetical protein WEC00_06080 [Dongiaceae bacterium]
MRYPQEEIAGELRKTDIPMSRLVTIGPELLLESGNTLGYLHDRFLQSHLGNAR